MKFTVLGATGFIGRHLVAHLQHLGFEVFAPVRGNAEIFKTQLGHVVYCVGMTADFRQFPFATMRAHTGFLTEVLERGQFESLLYLSSTRVYAGAAQTHESAALQTQPQSPSDLYNISKLAGESLTLHSGRANTKVVRLSNVVGFDPGSANFLNAVIQEAIQGHITLRSSLNSEKDYILLEDVLEMLPKIALFGKQQIYNLASGANISHAKLVNLLCEITGCTFEVDSSAEVQYFNTINNINLENDFNFEFSSILEKLPSLVGLYSKGSK